MPAFDFVYNPRRGQAIHAQDGRILGYVCQALRSAVVLTEKKPADAGYFWWDPDDLVTAREAGSRRLVAWNIQPTLVAGQIIPVAGVSVEIPDEAVLRVSSYDDWKNGKNPSLKEYILVAGKDGARHVTLTHAEMSCEWGKLADVLPSETRVLIVRGLSGQWEPVTWLRDQQGYWTHPEEDGWIPEGSEAVQGDYWRCNCEGTKAIQKAHTQVCSDCGTRREQGRPVTNSLWADLEKEAEDAYDSRDGADCE